MAKRVLLIDDSSTSRGIVRRALGEEYSIVEASDGIRGLELYFIERPDVVLLDLTMPGMNGMEVLERLRMLDPHARVIVGTADVQEISEQRAFELGAVGYLTKPFTPDAVREAVQKTLVKS